MTLHPTTAWGLAALRLRHPRCGHVTDSHVLRWPIDTLAPIFHRAVLQAAFDKLCLLYTSRCV